MCAQVNALTNILHMNMKHVTQPNDPANPIYTTTENRFKESVTQLDCAGMTKRELIATHVLAGRLAGDWSGNADVMAQDAVRYADALIHELSRTAQ